MSVGASTERKPTIGEFAYYLSQLPVAAVMQLSAAYFTKMCFIIVGEAMMSSIGQMFWPKAGF